MIAASLQCAVEEVNASQPASAGEDYCSTFRGRGIQHCITAQLALPRSPCTSKGHLLLWDCEVVAD